MVKKYGLDFGTTNSSIAIEVDGQGQVLEIDQTAVDARVIRTLLFLLRRELVIAKTVTEKRLNAQEFRLEEIKWEGEQKQLIGQQAVDEYLQENKNRTVGVRRKIFTGRMIIPAVSASVDQSRVDPVPEYFEEVDYGTGRLIQALKTALKSPYYKGTTVFGEYYSLERLIAAFVGELRDKANRLVGQDIREVRCGRPVHFRDDPIKDKAAQDRLENALRLAGFEKINFDFEPVAAAKQYISSEILKRVQDDLRSVQDDLRSVQDDLRSVQDDTVVFVFDFGGGTLDTAVVNVDGTSVGAENKVLAADGVYIGGDLLNADIMQAKLWPYFGSRATYGDHGMRMPEYIYESLQAWYSIPNLNNPDMMNLLEKVRYRNSDREALDRLIYLIKMNLGFGLYEAIEQAKKELSEHDRARIIFHDGPIDIDMLVTRQEFEAIIFERVKEIGEVVLRTLNKAGIEAEEIDVVVRTGGSSLIPIFEKLLVEIFGKDKIRQFETFTSIAAGLALVS